MDFFKILSYGVIGLGFILAFFSYRLLAEEQRRERPRSQFLMAIKLFMGFSIALCLIGFGAEYFKDPNQELAKIREENVKLTTKCETYEKEKPDQEKALQQNKFLVEENAKLKAECETFKKEEEEQAKKLEQNLEVVKHAVEGLMAENKEEKRKKFWEVYDDLKTLVIRKKKS